MCWHVEGGFQQSHSHDRCPEVAATTLAYSIWGSSTALLYSRFSKPAPMFLDDSFRKWARIREFVPPFGIKGQGMLETLTHSTLTSHRPKYLPTLSIGLHPQKSPCWGSTLLPHSQQCLTFSPSFPSCLFSSLFTQNPPLCRG